MLTVFVFNLLLEIQVDITVVLLIALQNQKNQFCTDIYIESKQFSRIKAENYNLYKKNWKNTIIKHFNNTFNRKDK